jgi:hypothetical protein
MSIPKTDRKPDAKSMIATSLAMKGPGTVEDLHHYWHDIMGNQITQDDVTAALKDLERIGWAKPMVDEDTGEHGWRGTTCPACRLPLTDDRPESGRTCMICGLPTTTTKGNTK